MIASALTIQELTGQQRRLVLRGAGLPLQGASWKTEQRLVTKWYAGNPWEATQHVLGPVDAPSEWKGVWNTTRLIVTPPSWFDGPGAAEQQLVVASSLRDVFDGDLGLVRAGALLRVTWASDDGRSIAREGRIGPTEFSHTRFDDVAWTMTFIWVGRGSGPPRTTQFTQDNVDSAQRSAVNALNNLSTTIPGASGPFSTTPSVPGGAQDPTLGEWEAINPSTTAVLGVAAQAASSLATRISSAFSFASGASAGQPSSPASAFDLANDGTQAAVAANAMAEQLVYRLGELPAETQVAAGSTVAQLATAAAFLASVAESAQVAAATSQDLAAAAKKTRSALAQSTAQGDKPGVSALRATVTPARGDTFASLALRFYGSADLAGALARANGVPTYQVSPCPGQIVLVPVMSAADTSSP